MSLWLGQEVQALPRQAGLTATVWCERAAPDGRRFRAGVLKRGQVNAVSSGMNPELDFEDIPPLTNAPPQGLAAWVDHIREQDMPAFGQTVEAVRGIVADDNASASRLASVILRDQATTTKVLKLANSAYFNASRQGVSTISRAIVVLGFDVVADMTLGLALVDALVKGGLRTRVTEEMARCFLAASVARGLAKMRGEGRAEEVFIAALLARVGEMAFWCFGGEQAESLDAELDAVSDDAGILAAQQSVLGFPLRQLTTQLAREWRLSALLNDAIDPSVKSGTLVESIRLGHAVAKAVDVGWDSPKMRGVLSNAAAFTGLPLDELNKEFIRLSSEASRLAAGYGARDAAAAIPAPPGAVPEPVDEVVAAVELSSVSPAERQLNILRDLSMRILSGASFADVVYLACEGVLHGVGFDRVVVALVAPNRRQIIGKYALGNQSEGLARRFNFALGESQSDPIDLVFQSHKPLMLERPRGRLQGIAGTGPCCLAPIMGVGRCVGIIFAERDADSTLDEASYYAFVHFAQHLSLAVHSLRGSGT